MELENSGYRILETIGSGAFGLVQKIQSLNDGQIQVWKEICYGDMSLKEREQLLKEIQILQEIAHERIIRYLGRLVDETNQKVYIIMEYAQGGDIQQLITAFKEEDKTIPEEYIWKIGSQIIDGLSALHNNSNQDGKKSRIIVHRDLKPSNIFLDDKTNAKIGDFGLSTFLTTSNSFDDSEGQNAFAESNVGTPYYMSPEQVTQVPYDHKTDIWALGCILYEMCALQVPFQADNPLALAIKIQQGPVAQFPDNIYSQELKRVIHWCLEKRGDDRPSVNDLLCVPQISQRLRRAQLQKAEQQLDIQENNQIMQEQEINIKIIKQNERKLYLKEHQAIEQEKFEDLLSKFNELKSQIQKQYLHDLHVKAEELSETDIQITCDTNNTTAKSAKPKFKLNQCIKLRSKSSNRIIENQNIQTPVYETFEGKLNFSKVTTLKKYQLNSNSMKLQQFQENQTKKRQKVMIKPPGKIITHFTSNCFDLNLNLYNQQSHCNVQQQQHNSGKSTCKIRPFELQIKEQFNNSDVFDVKSQQYLNDQIHDMKQRCYAPKNNKKLFFL